MRQRKKLVGAGKWANAEWPHCTGLVTADGGRFQYRFERE